MVKKFLADRLNILLNFCAISGSIGRLERSNSEIKRALTPISAASSFCVKPHLSRAPFKIAAGPKFGETSLTEYVLAALREKVTVITAII